MHFLADDSSEVYASRPSTAVSRPGTAGGRRLTTAGSTSQLGPALENANTANAIIHRELGNDELLRIMNSNGIKTQNDLFVLAESGDYAKFKRLVDDLKVDLSTFKGLHGYALIHHAASRGHGSIVAELLRNNRFSVNLLNDLHETALHLAVYGGHLLLVDQLLDSGAEINAQTTDQETPLFYAARRKHVAVIRLLMQRGANADIINRFGEKAIDQAPDQISQNAFTDHINIILTPRGYDSANNTIPIHHRDLLRIFEFLPTNDLLRAASVNRKWHMVSGYESLWKQRGLRRWELALQSSLGFGPTTTMSFFRRPSSRSNSSSHNKSKSISMSLSAKEPGGKGVGGGAMS